MIQLGQLISHGSLTLNECSVTMHQLALCPSFQQSGLVQNMKCLSLKVLTQNV